MVIVLVAGYHHILIPAILKMEIKGYVVKEGTTKVFFYFDTALDTVTVLSAVKQAIKQSGSQYAYQLYTMYNGMIDLTDYLPEHIKKENKYYLNPNKDLSDQELKDFLETI